MKDKIYALIGVATAMFLFVVTPIVGLTFGVMDTMAKAG